MTDMAHLAMNVSGLCSQPPRKLNGSCADKGMLLPIVDESDWPHVVRVGLYLVGMLYMFLGISIAADVFMVAIERITSETRIKKVYNRKTGDYMPVAVKIWNPTIANLTLMALGSSAPEIMLSIIEIVGNDFQSGALGPSTIVGSAAFNLFFIGAVCVASIPKGESRRIEQYYVFLTTSAFGLLAYIWLLVMLVVISKNEIQLWEALVTLGFFFVLLVCAFFADKKFCCRGDRNKVAAGDTRLHREGSETFLTGTKSALKRSASRKPHGQQLEYEEIEKDIALGNPHLGEDQVARLAANFVAKQQSHSPLYYRLQATRWMANPVNEQIEATPNNKQKETLAKVSGDGDDLRAPPAGVSLIEFTAEQYAGTEREGVAKVMVRRRGDLNREVRVFFETIEGSAKEEDDFKPLKGLLTFKEGQEFTNVSIPLTVDDIPEKDEIFYIKLDVARPEDAEYIRIGKKKVAEVMITEKSGPCEINFEKTSLLVEETTGFARLPLIRHRSYNKTVTINWKTSDISAVEGEDYVGDRGSITFQPGEIRKTIDIQIVNDVEVNEKNETFKVALTGISEGSKIGEDNEAIVTIVGDERVFEWFSNVDHKVQENLDQINNVGPNSWKDQFKRALNVNNADVDSATFGDYVYHVSAFFWKLIFAFVPPPTVCKGWLTFLVGLCLIAVLTALVADFAGIFGCLIGLEDSITAITFVALGTSLPDLFASRLAAVMEKTADNSVGNINGSNSVNVFLGLGIPWVIAAAYWHAKGLPFCVYAGSLAFSVSVYATCAVLTLLLLTIRRYGGIFGYAELGGPLGTKWLCAILLVLLWLVYITLSILETTGMINI